MRYLSDITILLGSVFHHKVHRNTQFFHSVPQDSQQHHIMAFVTSLSHTHLKSEIIPEIIKISDTNILGFDGKNIKQWPLYKGVRLLHYLYSIVSPSESCQGQIIKTDDRGSKDVTILLSSGGWHVSQSVFPPSPGFIPSTETLIFHASWVNRTVVNHVITVF